jgi:hypothetical protein
MADGRDETPLVRAIARAILAADGHYHSIDTMFPKLRNDALRRARRVAKDLTEAGLVVAPKEETVS